MKYQVPAVAASLFAAGAFASPATAAVVDITASAAGTDFDVDGDGFDDFTYYSEYQGQSNVLKAFSPFDGVGPESATPFLPQSLNMSYPSIETNAGYYYGLVLGDFDGTPLYSGYAFVDTAGHIGEISTTLPGSVPEPATWAMMLLGFGAVGAAMRQRRRAPAAFA